MNKKSTVATWVSTNPSVRLKAVAGDLFFLRKNCQELHGASSHQDRIPAKKSTIMGPKVQVSMTHSMIRCTNSSM
jgi:hypothetical protein